MNSCTGLPEHIQEKQGGVSFSPGVLPDGGVRDTTPHNPNKGCVEHIFIFMSMQEHFSILLCAMNLHLLIFLDGQQLDSPI